MPSGIDVFLRNGAPLGLVPALDTDGGLALTLGGGEVRLDRYLLPPTGALAMVASSSDRYGSDAASGDRFGNVLYAASPSPAACFRPEIAFILTDDSSRAKMPAPPGFGQESPLTPRSERRQTGTTSGFATTGLSRLHAHRVVVAWVAIPTTGPECVEIPGRRRRADLNAVPCT